MSENQRELAVHFYNETWRLIDSTDRDAKADRMMLASSCASRALWEDIGGDEQHIVGDWQIGHVASLLGYHQLSLAFAQAAHEAATASDVPSWLVASTCEGLARAHAGAGNHDEFTRWAAKAREILGNVADPEDRALIESQLASIPRP